MARTKQTARKSTTPPLITWTRFRLPPGQEWPSWPPSPPGSVAADTFNIGPMTNVRGAGRQSIGRMVDDPSQAVYMISWGRRSDLDNFLTSPACTEFLRYLPEVELTFDDKNHAEDAPLPIQPTMASQTLEQKKGYEEQSTSNWVSDSAKEYRQHPRFLVLNNLVFGPTRDITKRVTLSSFLVPLDINKIDGGILHGAQEGLQSVFDYAPGYAYSPHPLFFWRNHTMWCWAPAATCTASEDSGGGDIGTVTLERTLVARYPITPPQVAPAVEEIDRQVHMMDTEKNPNTDAQVLICEFRIWDGVNNPEETEERSANADSEFRKYWEKEAEEVKASGFITAWKRERWDFRLVPRSQREADDEEWKEEFYRANKKPGNCHYRGRGT